MTSKRKGDEDDATVEKKVRVPVSSPSILWKSKLHLSITSNLPLRYKVPRRPDRIEFNECMNPIGPDSLTIYPNKNDPKSKPVWLTIYRKTDEAKEHRVIFKRKGSKPVEMVGYTEGSVFIVKGPGLFEMKLTTE